MDRDGYGRYGGCSRDNYIGRAPGPIPPLNVYTRDQGEVQSAGICPHIAHSTLMSSWRDKRGDGRPTSGLWRNASKAEDSQISSLCTLLRGVWRVDAAKRKRSGGGEGVATLVLANRAGGTLWGDTGAGEKALSAAVFVV
jgi:hypothetical protein